MPTKTQYNSWTEIRICFAFYVTLYSKENILRGEGGEGEEGGERERSGIQSELISRVFESLYMWFAIELFNSMSTTLKNRENIHLIVNWMQLWTKFSLLIVYYPYNREVIQLETQLTSFVSKVMYFWWNSFCRRLQ